MEYIADNLLIDILEEYSIDLDDVLQVKYYVGKNAGDNWLIYKNSSQMDTVFHLDKYSSPYVIVNQSIDQLTKNQILTAAVLCKSKSKYKNLKNISVLYTPIANTKLGNKEGSFIIKNNKKKLLIKI